MQIVSKIFSTIYKVKRSKFHSFLIPYSEYKSQFEKIKVNHPKAPHIIYAYRYINEFDQSQLTAYEKIFTYQVKILFSDIAKFEHSFKDYLNIEIKKILMRPGLILQLSPLNKS
jgi:hypothetical protein